MEIESSRQNLSRVDPVAQPAGPRSRQGYETRPMRGNERCHEGSEDAGNLFDPLVLETVDQHPGRTAVGKGGPYQGARGEPARSRHVQTCRTGGTERTGR